MFRKVLSILLVIIMSAAVLPADDESMSSLLVSDIPITYGDESFRGRILQKTGGRRDPIGLVLTGGSARAVAHLGVLEYLEENGIIPDFIISNSMGSIIGMLYAAGLKPDQIIEILNASELSDYFSFTLPLEGGLLLPSGFQTLVDSVVGADLRLEDLEIPIMVVCEDLVTRREVRITEGDFSQVMIASFALPVYFPPVEYRGHLLIDGGVVSLAPIDAAYEYTDTVILSTTFYDVPTLNLRNPITVLNVAFEAGKNQKAAEDIKAHDNLIWIRCAVEHFSFMDFAKAPEMAWIGYKSAEVKAAELSGLVRTGVSDSMMEIREGYKRKIANTVRSLSYFKRVEAAAPSLILGFSLESDQEWSAHKYLTDSVDLLFGITYRDRGFETGIGIGGAFDITTPETAGAYPAIEGFLSLYPLDNLRFSFEAAADFCHEPWYIPQMYLREGFDWIIDARKDFYSVAFRQGFEYMTSFKGHGAESTALIVSALVDGNLKIDWFDIDMSLGYLLSADSIAFENMRNYGEVRLSSRFYLPPWETFFIEAAVFSRFSLDGQGYVPLFLSDGYVSPRIGKDVDYYNHYPAAGASDEARYHASIISIYAGYDVPVSPTFGEFIIIEDTEIGVYADMLLRDLSFSVSTGVEFQTSLSLIGLVKLPFRMRLGYDSWSNSFAASFMLSLRM